MDSGSQLNNSPLGDPCKQSFSVWKTWIHTCKRRKQKTWEVHVGLGKCQKKENRRKHTGCMIIDHAPLDIIYLFINLLPVNKSTRTHDGLRSCSSAWNRTQAESQEGFTSFAFGLKRCRPSDPLSFHWKHEIGSIFNLDAFYLASSTLKPTLCQLITYCFSLWKRSISIITFSLKSVLRIS